MFVKFEFFLAIFVSIKNIRKHFFSWLGGKT